jgi:hypothetical protein
VGLRYAPTGYVELTHPSLLLSGSPFKVNPQYFLFAVLVAKWRGFGFTISFPSFHGQLSAP